MAEIIMKITKENIESERQICCINCGSRGPCSCASSSPDPVINVNYCPYHATELDEAICHTCVEERIKELETDLIKMEDEKHAIISPFYVKYRLAVSELAELTGLNYYWQNPDTSMVYRLSECKGKFVSFDHVVVERTKYEDERAGTLSKKEAKAQGFEVE